MSIHTKKEREGSVNEVPTRSFLQETCSLLLRTHTARLSGCICLTSVMPMLPSLYCWKLCSSYMLEQESWQGLIWVDVHKATASVFSALGGRELLTLEAGKGSCGSTSGSQGREHHYPQTHCLCVVHVLKRACTSAPWEPLRRHITGHHLSAFYFKISGMGPSALHS